MGYWFYGKNVSAPVLTDVSKNNDTVAPTPEVMMEDGSTSELSDGFYEDYSPEKLSRAENGKVVLFFRALWCPTCRAVHSDINSHLKDIPKDLSILKVDYDKSTELKRKYSVTYQHTFVQVDKDGNMILKWSSSPTLSELLTHIK